MLSWWLTPYDYMDGEMTVDAQMTYTSIFPPSEMKRDIKERSQDKHARYTFRLLIFTRSISVNKQRNCLGL
jgi:hypothetical protein